MPNEKHTSYMRKWRKRNPKAQRAIVSRQRNNMTYYFWRIYDRLKNRCNGKYGSKLIYIGLPFMNQEQWNVFLTLTFKTRLRLFEAYKASGFKRGLAPSIDRIDNAKGYIFDNCQWLTQSENSAKKRTLPFERDKYGRFLRPMVAV